MLALILSIIGCITGVGGILLHFSTYLSERPRLTVTQDSYNSCYFKKLKHFDGYQTDFQGTLFLCIENNSALPISISEIIIQNKTEKLYVLEYNQCLDFHYVLEKSSNSTTEHSFPTKSKCLNIPIRLDSYGYTEGFLFLPFVKCDDATKEIRYKIIMRNSRRRDFHTSIVLHKIETKII